MRKRLVNYRTLVWLVALLAYWAIPARAGTPAFPCGREVGSSSRRLARAEPEQPPFESGGSREALSRGRLLTIIPVDGGGSNGS
jgi:hypothetical protein